MGNKPDKISILKKAIIEVAKDKKIGKNSYHRITNVQIWDWIVDNGYYRTISERYISTMRPKLPKKYR